MALALAAPLAAETVEVKAGQSLQAAIDSAPAGAVLRLGEGTWQEDITITKSITLRGAGVRETILKGTDSGQPVIRITGEESISVMLTGLGITGASGESCADAASYLCPHGILVRGKARVQITKCQVTGNASCGLFAADEASLLATDSSFSGNKRAGVWAHGAARVRLYRVSLAGNAYGLLATKLSMALVKDSLIRANALDGLLLADGAYVYLWGNDISGNGRLGVGVDIPSCYRTDRTFSGLVRGAGNRIPGASEASGNAKGAVCPGEIDFLASQLGGVYPQPHVEELLKRVPAPILGSAEAPVVMLEFSDLSCPYCARFALNTLPQLRQEFIDAGKLRLYFFPFPVHGDVAIKEAEAGFCAADQGLFWEFQEAMFQRSLQGGFPDGFTPEAAAEVIQGVGGDPDALKACLAEGRHNAEVMESIAIARELGVRGTPTFFVGRWVVPGAYPYEVFQSVVEKALAEAAAGK